jgi:hypothetical protein
MKITEQLAAQLRAIHFGGNWTMVNMRDTLANVSWQQATQQYNSCNSIATLTFHTSYFVQALIEVFQTGELNAKDELSFAHPPIHSHEQWTSMLEEVWAKAELAAQLIEKMPEQQLNETFVLKKYGSYFRNITGIIEHAHYHLGQISLIKKFISLQ